MAYCYYNQYFLRTKYRVLACSIHSGSMVPSTLTKVSITSRMWGRQSWITAKAALCLYLVGPHQVALSPRSLNNHVPGSVLSVLHTLSQHLRTVLWARYYYYFHFTVGETQRWGVNLPKVYRANNSYPNLLTLGPAPSPSLHNNRTMCQALY